MKKEEQWTEELIDLLHNKSFAQLSEDEKGMVEGTLSATEYEALHEAHKAGSQYFAQDEELFPSPAVKQKLDQQFRVSHARQVSFVSRPVVLWKAAAVFLLLFGASFICLKNKLTDTKTIEMLVYDTVFVEKPIELVRYITDTVIEYREAVAGKAKKTDVAPPAMAATYAAHRDTNTMHEPGAEGIGIRTMQSADLSRELNASGRSMKEDELVSMFSFTKI